MKGTPMRGGVRFSNADYSFGRDGVSSKSVGAFCGKDVRVLAVLFLRRCHTAPAAAPRVRTAPMVMNQVVNLEPLLPRVREPGA
jgi:hypothetical protein